jgi:hypothetical protein
MQKIIIYIFFFFISYIYFNSLQIYEILYSNKMIEDIINNQKNKKFIFNDYLRKYYSVHY